MTTYKVVVLEDFRKDIKKLIKKHKHIEDDLKKLFNKLQAGNLEGDRIKEIKEVVYKMRLKSSDNNKGKSGGFRVIYEVQQDKIVIQLIQIYSKAKKANTTQAEIQRRLKSN